MAESIGIAVAEFGYWGATLARNTVAALTTHLVGVIDSDLGQWDSASHTHPTGTAWQSVKQALTDDRVDGVVSPNRSSGRQDRITGPLLSELTAFGELYLTGDAPLTDGKHVRKADRGLRVCRRDLFIVGGSY